MLIATGKKVRKAAITATAPQVAEAGRELRIHPDDPTIGAMARIGIVCEATM